MSRIVTSKLFIQLVFFASCMCSFVLSAAGDTYRVQWSNGNIGRFTAGKPLLFEALWNSDTQEFQWIVTFSRFNGVLPEGFKFAVNGTGLVPKGHDGELAFYYFDARDPADPKLTVYAYNGVAGEGVADFWGTWQDGSQETGKQTPDPILSSESTDPDFNGGFVKRFVYEELDADTLRLGFVIDATKIQNHVPNYPGDLSQGEVWQGTSFAEYLGMWFHPLSGISASYAADDSEGPAFKQGFLTEFSWDKVGWIDLSDIPATKEDPICESVTVSADTIKYGESVTAEVVVSDPQSDPLTLSYMGLPSGTYTISPESGQYVSPYEPIQFSWTPGLTDVGTTLLVKVVVADPYGAQTECPFSVRVLPNTPPTCDAGGEVGYSNVTCTGPTKTVQLIGEGSTDSDPLSILHFAWETNCPAGMFSDSNALNPEITFSSVHSDGTPVSCSVFLTVSDQFESRTCEAAVSLAPCSKDCLGVIEGDADFDVCGVCNGDGTSCLDCAGTPFGSAKEDRCGVCNGDGMSCVSCQSVTVGPSLIALDVGTASLRNIARRVVARIRNLRPRDRIANRLLQDSEKLHTVAWEAINVLPATVQQCAPSPFCFATSYDDSLKTYSEASSELRKNVQQLARRLRRIFRATGLTSRRARKRWRKPLRRSREINQVNQTELQSLPTTTNSCL